ncbi:hypothetical protein HYQ45_014982 [Verticillium longisporum]|uniref:Uncharacterized protein n=1 Tax=Verticillium longisporum TaxID=100787 RepID=A0A8I2ZBM3_VERLO|nr:hypothetical protein HYQ45_014982 [Verticillium longisporum]
MDSKSASCHSSTTCSTSRECRDGYGPPSSIRWTTPSHSDVCPLLALAPPLSPQRRGIPGVSSSAAGYFHKESVRQAGSKN